MITWQMWQGIKILRLSCPVWSIRAAHYCDKLFETCSNWWVKLEKCELIMSCGTRSCHAPLSFLLPQLTACKPTWSPDFGIRNRWCARHFKTSHGPHDRAQLQEDAVGQLESGWHWLSHTAVTLPSNVLKTWFWIFGLNWPLNNKIKRHLMFAILSQSRDL